MSYTSRGTSFVPIRDTVPQKGQSDDSLADFFSRFEYGTIDTVLESLSKLINPLEYSKLFRQKITKTFREICNKNRWFCEFYADMR